MVEKTVLTQIPHLGYEESVLFDTIITEFETGQEVRRNRRANPLRSFRLTLDPLLIDDDEVQEGLTSLFSFYVARKGALQSFWFHNINDRTVSQLISAADPTSVTLSTPPIKKKSLVISYNSGANVIKDVDGVGTLTQTATDGALTLLSGSIVYETGALSMDFDVTPSSVGAVTYDFYRIVRFAEDSLSATLLGKILFSIGIGLKEVNED